MNTALGKLVLRAQVIALAALCCSFSTAAALPRSQPIGSPPDVELDPVDGITPRPTPNPTAVAACEGRSCPDASVACEDGGVARDPDRDLVLATITYDAINKICVCFYDVPMLRTCSKVGDCPDVQNGADCVCSRNQETQLCPNKTGKCTRDVPLPSFIVVADENECNARCMDVGSSFLKGTCPPDSVPLCDSGSSCSYVSTYVPPEPTATPTPIPTPTPRPGCDNSACSPNGSTRQCSQQTTTSCRVYRQRCVDGSWLIVGEPLPITCVRETPS